MESLNKSNNINIKPVLLSCPVISLITCCHLAISSIDIEAITYFL